MRPLLIFFGGNASTSTGGDISLPGDANLNLINQVYTGGIQIPTFDAAVLEFDFIPTKETLTLEYLYASEEYCDFVGTQFIDQMAIFLSGPGIQGPFNSFGISSINIAEFPDDVTGQMMNVSINNIHDRRNPQFYVDNNTFATASSYGGTCSLIDPTNNPYTSLVAFDGWTIPLVASYDNLQIGETYKIRIAVADGADHIFGSAIFLKAGSFDAGIPFPSIVADAGPDQVLTCQVNDVTLLGEGSTGVNITFDWTGPSGFSSTNQNVQVTEPGDYILMITDPNTSETATDTVTVSADFEFPEFEIEFTTNILTCTNPTVVLIAVLNDPSTNAEYAWQGPAGFFSTDDEVEVSNSGAYSLIVTNIDNGCSNEFTVEVLEDTSDPFVIISQTQVLDCTTNSVTLDGSGSSGGVALAYEWFSQNGNILGTAITQEVSEPGVYTLLVSNLDNGCTSEASAIVSADTNIPIASIASAPAITPGEMIQLDGTGSTAGSNIEYIWTTINGSIVSGANTLSPAINLEGEYCLTVVNTNNGCESTTCIDVLPGDSDPFIADAGPDQVLDCNATAVTLGSSSNPTGPEFSYTWTDQGQNFYPNQPFIEAFSGGIYFLTITNNNTGESSSDTVEVFVDQDAPVVIIGPGQILTCQENVIQLFGSTSTPNVSYTWTTANGNILTNPTQPNVNIDQGGEYILTVINNQNFCIGTASISILEDIDTPSVFIESPSVLNCTNQAVLLDGSSSSGGPDFVYTWIDFQGNLFSNESSVFVSECGAYTLEVENTSNGCFSVATVIVECDFETPSFEIQTPNLLIPGGTVDVTIIMSGSNSNVNFVWSSSNPIGFLGQNTSTITVSQPGEYCLTITDSFNGCISVKCVSVELDGTNTVIADAGPDQTLTCRDSEFILGGPNTTIGENIKYLWVESFVDNAVVIDTTAQITVEDFGIYILSVTDCVTGMVAMDTVEVSDIRIDPIVNIANPDVINCANTYTLLIGSSSSMGPEFSYTWLYPDGSPIGTTPDISVSDCGEYTYIIEDLTSGCISIGTVIVECDQDIPEIAINASSLELNCEILQVPLEGSIISIGLEFVLYTWTDAQGNLISNEPSIIVTECGEYFLEVLNLENNCASTEAVIVVCDFREPIFSIADPGLLDQGGTLNLEWSPTLTSQFNNFSWFTKDGNIVSNDNTLAITIDQSGTYCLEVTDLDNGCASENCVTVEQANAEVTIADAGPDIEINCSTASVEFCLGGGNTSEGPEFTYEWTSANGAVVSTERIFKPATTQLIDFPFTLLVTNTNTGDQATDTVNFSQDIEAPTIDVQALSILNCIDTEITIGLAIDTSSTTNFSIVWDGPGIISASNIEDIVVDEPGEYMVSVTNLDNGCFSTATVFVDQDIEIFELLVVDANEITCDTFRILDPTPVFEQLNFDTCIGSWQEQEGLLIDTFPIAFATQSGTYTFNKVDPVNGCLDKIIYNISLPDEVIADAGSNQVINCNETVTLGGTNSANLEFNWFGPNGVSLGNSITIEVTTPGLYTLQILDPSTGCEGSDEVLVTAGTMAPELMLAVTDVSCFGADDGSIDVMVTGGTPPYTFDDLSQMGLLPGNYTVTVTDANGCMVIASTAIIEPEVLEVDFTINADNQLEAIVTGGVGGYTYDWNVEADSNIVSNLISGTDYELTVTDANGCELMDTFFFVVDAVFSPTAKEISVFPNPTDGLLHLQLDVQANSDAIEIQLFDIQGIPMHFDNRSISKSMITLDVSHLQAGAYILQATIDGALYYQKITVF